MSCMIVLVFVSLFYLKIISVLLFPLAQLLYVALKSMVNVIEYGGYKRAIE